MPQKKTPPTDSVSGLHPHLIIGLPEKERPTLKGGVNFKSVRATQNRFLKFFNNL